MGTRHKNLAGGAPGTGFAARRGAACGLMVLSAMALTALPAAAQHYNVIGQAGPAVVVDTTVLDELGPPNNIGTASSAAAANRFGPGVVVRTTRPASEAAPRGAATVPPSRLLAVPALPGRATPQIGNRIVVNTASNEAAAPRPTPQSAPPPAPRAEARPEPKPEPKPMARPAAPPSAPPSAPPERQAITPTPPAPAVVKPPPPPAPPVANVPPAAARPTPTAPSAPTPSAPPPTPSQATPAPAAPVQTAAPPAPTPVAPPAAAPARPAETQTQTAALPPAASASGANRLSFDGGSAALSDGARQELDRMAASLSGNDQRLQVVAYAASQGNNTSAARRLSLSRALAVRSYLIDKGIRSTRIDVRAMGTPESASGGPADRVDLVLVGQ